MVKGAKLSTLTLRLIVHMSWSSMQFFDFSADVIQLNSIIAKVRKA